MKKSLGQIQSDICVLHRRGSHKRFHIQLAFYDPA
jgi:hypothetical protein